MLQYFRLAKLAAIFVVFWFMVISAHTSIASLSQVDLWISRHKSEAESSQTRFKRAVSISLLDYGEENATVQGTEDLVLRKCCKPDEWLDENYKCIPRDEVGAEFEWFPQSMLVNENYTRVFGNLSRARIEVAPDDFCKDYAISWTDDDSLHYFIELGTNKLLQFNLSRTVVVASFLPSSYCLDEKKSPKKSFAVLICPCSEKICIQKCCPTGYYFDLLNNTCVQHANKDVENLKLDFYTSGKKRNETVDYFLISRPPNCSIPDTLINREMGNDSSVSIQENGDLMTVLEKGSISVFTQPDRYCVDNFSNGTIQFQINGFFCHEYDIITESEEKSSTSNPIGRNIEGLAVNKLNPKYKIKFGEGSWRNGDPKGPRLIALKKVICIATLSVSLRYLASLIFCIKYFLL